MNGSQQSEIYRLELNRLIVVPPTGIAFPDPCTSHIVNAICEDNSKDGYVMGKITTEFHLEDCQIDVGKCICTYVYPRGKSLCAVLNGSEYCLPSAHSWQVT